MKKIGSTSVVFVNPDSKHLKTFLLAMGHQPAVPVQNPAQTCFDFKVLLQQRHMRALKHRLCRWAYRLAALAILLTSQSSAAQGVVVFYDPDANHQAIVQITTWFNDYFNENDAGLRFQPVQNHSSFEKLLEDPQTVLALVSANYLRKPATSLTPFLVPTRGGDAYYRKQLLVKKGSTQDSLAGKTIAVTVAATDKVRAGKQVLGSLKSGGVPVLGARVIPVSKDIDALLALTFGQVQAAFVAPASVDVLRRVNPAAVNGFESRYQSPQILRPPLCTIPGRSNAEQKRSWTLLFQEMLNSQKGAQALNTLGFDGWTLFSAGMLKG